MISDSSHTNTNHVETSLQTSVSFVKKASIALLASIQLFVGTGVVFAQDDVSFVGIKKSRTAQILDNFKESEETLLFKNSPFTPEEERGLFESEGKIRNLEEMIQRIQESKDSLKDQKREVTTRKYTLQSMLQELDGNISDVSTKISDSEESIRIKNKEIADLLREMVQLQDRIDSNREAIMSYLSYIYKKGDTVYGDEESVDLIRTLVFTDGNVSDVLANYHFLTILEITGQNFLEERRSLLSQYYVQTQTIKQEKNDVIALKKKLNDEKQQLEDQKAYKQEILDRTRGQEALFNEYISDRQEKQGKIEERLATAMNEYDESFTTVAERSNCRVSPSVGIIAINASASKKCDELNLAYQSEKNLRQYASEEVGPNPLSWPVDPRYISTYYQDADYFDSVGSSHVGIDIPTEQGTEIKSPMPGYVYFVNPPTPNGYGYFAVKHPNGFVTVYGHVSEIKVKKYDFVEAGQVIALSGGAPGTPGAGIMTSGAHLHFEVWLNRETVDPLRFLDTTFLRYETLSNKYKYKFIEDLKLRYGYMANTSKYDTFVIRGETEIERQKYLLEHYAAPSFRDWNTWTEEAVGAKLDPSFLMCIGLAETGLGRNLKTAYNVGNIGNTDSGDTQGFISARDGIYWMGKTLNNKYLGDYQRISDLSRWGNKSGPIYASSPKNWQENLVRCLSSLKGRFVEDGYLFRMVPEELEAATPPAMSTGAIADPLPDEKVTSTP